MDYLQFLQSVELMAGVDREGAKLAVLATLREDVVPLDRLSGQLPPDYGRLFL